MGKNVLVIGRGAREHAIIWKLSQSDGIGRILAAPGNAGMAELAECFDISVNDTERLIELAKEQEIDLTIVGPEVPLMAGIVDAFEAQGLKIFGPRKNAAILEGSKVFSKNLMKKYGIPSADFASFTDVEEAKAFVRERRAPIVVKVDGLAAGKGVVVAQDEETALSALENMLVDKAFGSAGLEVVVEECLEGEEVSVFALCDGKNVVPLVAAQDHKRIFDGDQGPNTGGMGAYSSPGFYTPEIHQRVMEEILQPIVKAMASEGRPYKGVLFLGLMLTAKGPQVLEFNVRWGDPETQVVLPMLDSDFLAMTEAVADGTLNNIPMAFESGVCVCVVMAAEGYPGEYETGRVITGLNDVGPDTMVFHGGTRRIGSQVVTDGGRVLSVVCKGETIAQAIDKVYGEIHHIDFAGAHYRKDIGARMLKL
ncbi:MAG: phosphoribosylamine--glycine ligase [Syntrophomonadaceae bacterium]|nr:phosphoribosylamine--glycine ligase [Syntrophomonadaceae bacterium]